MRAKFCKYMCLLHFKLDLYNQIKFSTDFADTLYYRLSDQLHKENTAGKYTRNIFCFL